MQSGNPVLCNVTHRSYVKRSCVYKINNPYNFRIALHSKNRNAFLDKAPAFMVTYKQRHFRLILYHLPDVKSLSENQYSIPDIRLLVICAESNQKLFLHELKLLTVFPYFLLYSVINQQNKQHSFHRNAPLDRQ